MPACAALAAGAAVAAEGQQVVLAMLARRAVLVVVLPGVLGHGLAQIGAGPTRLVGRFGDQHRQALLGAWVATDIEPVLIERLLQPVDLRACGLDLGLADLAEELRPHIAGQQADDDHHHQQLKQGKAARISTVLTDLAE